MITHYEILNTIAQYKAPTTTLHGDVSHGKSRVSNTALSMLGIQDSHFLTFLTRKMVKAHMDGLFLIQNVFRC